MKMPAEEKVSYYVNKYGVFHRILQKQYHPVAKKLSIDTKPKASATWLRLIVMFWNARVMKAAFRFGIAAVIINQYERPGFAVILLCLIL